MYYTYILRSKVDSQQLYVGHTTDLKRRLTEHNAGKSPHTAKFKPWSVVWCGCFESEKLAIAFEAYLKTASGKAFLRKRLISL